MCAQSESSKPSSTVTSASPLTCSSRGYYWVTPRSKHYFYQASGSSVAWRRKRKRRRRSASALGHALFHCQPTPPSRWLITHSVWMPRRTPPHSADTTGCVFRLSWRSKSRDAMPCPTCQSGTVHSAPCAALLSHGTRCIRTDMHPHVSQHRSKGDQEEGAGGGGGRRRATENQS